MLHRKRSNSFARDVCACYIGNGVIDLLEMLHRKLSNRFARDVCACYKGNRIID